jgi:hypothetical protein
MFVSLRFKLELRKENKGLRQLFSDLPTKYIDSAIYKAKQYPTDKSVVFGGKRLFEKLCKNHLTGKVREGLKKQ